MKKRIIIGILIAALVAGGSAGGATYYKKSHQKTVSVVSVDSLAGQYYMDDTNLNGNIVTSATQSVNIDKDMIIKEVYMGYDKVSPGYVGYHPIGGGSAMMGLDALNAVGLKAANYADTSGNPVAAKIYRVAKATLSQPNIEGYLLGGFMTKKGRIMTSFRLFKRILFYLCNSL